MASTSVVGVAALSQTKAKTSRRSLGGPKSCRAPRKGQHAPANSPVLRRIYLGITSTAKYLGSEIKYTGN